MKFKFLTFLLFLCCGICGAKAQEVALKTNLLSDAFLNPNLAAEVALAPRWTIDVSGQFNTWNLSHDRKWKHWVVQPEIRYWFCDRFAGHFVGAHLLGGQYNVGGIDIPFSFLGTDFKKLKDTRYQGWFGGLGVAYGYAWAIAEHWNIEGEIGIGWTYTRFDRFRCSGCGKKIEENKPHNYFGVTKAAINLVYLF
ncbi:DUF3575 domain-containing protein [Lepagella muris]|jgi:hypothetical protein|uniref:DUF3575 domain-containing protein n=1 Tax=Lepagella muris TaxID=3032870 RepID=A0AC61RL31_9BACT|nr:DUF3575 domain-containing protein [Lepagella muris]TGY79531.1 DUF3575 domain-containing protein [Lepagella muris]THG53001.1 DUF3575 domain-containing protein [Bacteroidales bacterium]TKC61921.1 DUF3575 domain-containing protein [Bacteroidales bacterium]